MSPSRALVAALSLLLVPSLALAANVRSEVDARRIGVQDQLLLTITIEGSGGPAEVALPALTNLEIVGGPSQSTQVSILNGRMTQSRSYTYVLQARAVGKAEIGPVSAGEQSAPAIPIEVVAGSLRSSEPQRRQGRAGVDPFGQDPFGDPFEQMLGRRQARGREPRLVLEAVPSRTRLRVGEPLVLTYVLYTQASVSDLQLKDAPQYAGFWAEDLERPQPQGEPATLGGEAFTRFPILRKLLFPTRAGALTLPAASFRIGIARQGFFDVGGSVERATKPVTINVDPLPEAPGFSGAVGHFEVSAALDRQTVPLGEAATLRFRVSGKGNLKWIERGPEVAPRGAKVYPPQVRTDLRATADGIEGSRTWEFVVVPDTTGAVEIPPLSFSWFDPSAGRIVSRETPALSLRVEGGTVSAGLPAPSAAGPRVATGALPLRSQLDRRPASALALSGRALAILAGLVVLLHAGLWLAGRVPVLRLRGPGAAGAPSRSVRAALRHLERAGQGGQSKEQVAALVEQALHEAFGELAEEDDSERARAVRRLLDEVRFVRYAPQLGDYSDKIRDLAVRGRETVRRWA